MRSDRVVASGGRDPEIDGITLCPSDRQCRLRAYLDLFVELTGRHIEIITCEEWQRRVIVPLTESSPLYPLTLYFQGRPSEEYMHFETALAQASRTCYGIEYPGEYRKLLGEAYDKTLRRVLDIG
jgi:hypothetical protein